ncbi:HAMP domain-containing sensor histidine kinase [Sporosarcina sp. FSL K6-1522]|uniref:HAMP domain-containing sensor histidine kinase n=1 Tax=Sporosarcina sp. FSL K6-1522 TaxID=2921554 RepID=UPI00315AD21D
MIETLLLNVLFLLFPVLIAVIFFENRLTNIDKYILITLASIALIFCMAFPFALEIGFIFDLRYIPFVIVALYGGYKMVFPLYIVLNGYRMLIGGEGIYQSLLFSTIIFIVVPLLSKKFMQQDAKGRVVYAMAVTFSTMAFYFFVLSFNYEQLMSDFWGLMTYALVIHMIVVALIMSLIEKVISNVKTREMYLRAERLKDISDLTASIAHEIRNPLTVTNGFLQLLSGSKTITPEEKQYLTFSLKELGRAEQIVSDFLAFSKPQSANMVYANLKDEIEYVENILSPYAKLNKVMIQVRFSNKSKLHYDKNQMTQCFINLFKNGIEAMREHGGTLLIDVSEQKKEIVIRIQDNGQGMTYEEVRQLGKPYYSTKKEGTGLGMLMVYSTIRNVKGKMTVDSELGKGTTFLISIPTERKHRQN